MNIFVVFGHITNSQRDQLPLGLIGQLAEHCTDSAKIRSLNPALVKIFILGFTIRVRVRVPIHLFFKSCCVLHCVMTILGEKCPVGPLAVS